MTLKDRIFEHLQKHGPQTNAELVTKFKIKAASMRRTCGEMAREGRIAPMPSKTVRRWGVSADARAASADIVAPRSAEAPTGASTKLATMPKPTPAEKRDDKPADPKDWRMTDFTF